ncbi:hypothetical protein E2H86_06330 [Pseudomonas putida]|uniref:hypothetical protein n=1 Tax=Pseudomonas putida group TaxID=136845 RepID=UPI00105946BD|nr:MULTISPECIES: hypothetical protein [Pseudomonas putida group]MBF8744615.1 hypothetical protein [Pseudomonas monteilii]TDJ78377.1 hypothetical protein E2H86_06330 [Pseudomonas putida]
MKTLAITLLLGGLAFQATASADDAVMTAHIAADGQIVKQSGKWVESVTLQSQPDYFSQYKLKLDPAQWQQAPGFCVASPIDLSTETRLMHGQAKVVGAPTTTNVTVNTQLVDLKGPSGNNDMEFMLMCSR